MTAICTLHVNGAMANVLTYILSVEGSGVIKDAVGRLNANGRMVAVAFKTILSRVVHLSLSWMIHLSLTSCT
jgi:hypothetical protein